MDFFTSIKNKTISILLLLISIILVIIAVTFTIIDNKEYDSVVINTAGRQRMLAQKMAKESIARAIEGNTAVSSSHVEKTVQLFEISLKALTRGGSTYKDLEMNNRIDIPVPFSDEILAQLQKVESLWPEYKKLIMEVNSSPDTVKNSINRIVILSTEVLKESNSAVYMIQKYSESRISTLKTVLIIGLVLSLLAAFVFYTIINAHLVRPVTRMQKIFKEVSGGNLTHNIPVERDDEIGQLAEDINSFIGEMSKLISSVQENIDSVSSASVEISSTADEITSTVKEQSDQAHSVSSAIHELTETSQDIAKAMSETQEMSEESSQLTNHGGEVIQESMNNLRSILKHTNNLKLTVNNLEGSTDKIGNIIDVINDVSDQTNLLALNAAIEAARAGEAGRGFAVVADEVRKLAERSATATKEIEHIIVSLQQEAKEAGNAMSMASTEVDKGSELGNKALEVLQEIIQTGLSVKDSAISVANAVEMENQAIDDINDSIRQIASGTVQSSTAISEMAHTAEDLARDSEKLKALVENYKTK